MIHCALPPAPWHHDVGVSVAAASIPKATSAAAGLAAIYACATTTAATSAAAVGNVAFPAHSLSIAALPVPVTVTIQR